MTVLQAARVGSMCVPMVGKSDEERVARSWVEKGNRIRI